MGSLTDLFKERGANVALAETPVPPALVLGTIPADQCIDLSSENTSGNPQALKISELIDTVENSSPQMKVFIDNARDLGTMICEIDGTPMEFAGGFVTDNLIGLNSGKNELRRSAAEEFIHLYQDVDMLPDSYTPQDAFLWNTGIEAQAKLSVAVEAVRQKINGDPYLYNQHNKYDANAEGQASYYLYKQVERNGADALEDPAVLKETFGIIMENENFISDYYHLKINANAYATYTGAESLTGQKFAQTFGFIIGEDPRNNFLTGAISTRDDVVNMLPKSVSAYEWVNGEDNPPLSVNSSYPSASVHKP